MEHIESGLSRAFVTASALLLSGVLAACGGGGGDSGPPPTVSVTLLSSRANMVTDESALVRVDVSAGEDVTKAQVTLEGTDVTGRFKATSATSMTGLIAGLRPGQNRIVATLGGLTTTLLLNDTGKDGPVISGAHQSPFICQTDTFALPDGSTLGAAVDANCNAPTKVLYLYKPAGGTAFRVLSSTTTLPADMGTTTTSDNRTVNYIVRLETGTLNRAIYQFAVLFNPATDTVPNPAGTFASWNRKLIFMFGPGAGVGYRQGNTLITGVTNDLMLGQGFAVISSTLNVGATVLNDVLSGETASMVKERFVKSFGVPIYTMGWGGSGGSMQQQLVANNYPGLVDGITPGASFPDLLSVVPPATDCSLLARALAASKQSWSLDQKTAIAGYVSWIICDGGPNTPNQGDWMHSFSPRWIVPTKDGSCAGLPDSMIYHPATNRTGARCDVYDALKNLVGVDPATGFARRPWDNVGVQYGLRAFSEGKISAEQFVELNELVGGYDSDANFQSARTVADADALRAVYAYGRLNQMANLASIPIVDSRPYVETSPNFHDSVRSFISRARLAKANGSAANHVIIRTGPVGPSSLNGEILRGMDEWIMAIKNDNAPAARAVDKVARNKPAALTDACYTAGGQRIAEPADPSNGGQCGAMYPIHANPRMVAGAPLADDVLKCQLRPLQSTDYPGMSAAQFARLVAVFPAGVCDYSKPGAGLVPLQDVWLKYTSPGVASPL